FVPRRRGRRVARTVGPLPPHVAGVPQSPTIRKNRHGRARFSRSGSILSDRSSDVSHLPKINKDGRPREEGLTLAGGGLMPRLRPALAPLAALLLLTCVPRPAPAVLPAAVVLTAVWIGDYLLGRVVDEAVDWATGQPDRKELDKRLRQLEGDANLHSEMREEIRRLRLSSGARVTRDEFRKRAEATGAGLRETEARLLGTEMLLEKQDVRIKDLEDGKGAASSGVPATFLRRGDAFLQQNNHQRAVA